MAGFLYFRAGNQAKVNQQVAQEQLGLGYAITGSCAGGQVNDNNPTKKPGFVFADTARQAGKTVGIYPDQQTWGQMPNIGDRGELWVGYWNDAKPMPDDLVREQIITGDRVRLDDGNWWTIPLVRQVDSDSNFYECALPRPWKVGLDGKWCKGEVGMQHKHLWALTEPFVMRQFCKDFQESEGIAEEISDEQALDAATALLKTNYVVDGPELGLLGVFQVAQTLTNVPLVANHYVWFIDQLQKKSTLPLIETESTTNGGDAD